MSGSSFKDVVSNNGDGILLRASGGAAITATVNGNAFSGVNGAKTYAINTGFGSTSSTGVVRGWIRNNHIGTSRVALSGASQADCIIAEANGAGTGTHTVSVTGNTLYRCYDRGIYLLGSREGNNTLNATVTGNTVDHLVESASRNAIYLESGSSLATETGAVCADISSNTLTAATAGDEIRVRQRSVVTMRFPGYAGAAGSDADLKSYLEGRNALGGTALVSHTYSSGFPNAGASCATP